MESRIPLPTDNIYKFYALFGFVLLIASMAAFLYLHKTTNELIFEAAIAVEEVATKEKPTSVDTKRKEMMEKRVAVAVEDRNLFNNILSAVISVALCLMAYGFWHWQMEVQPKQDRLLDLQIEKAEQDLKKPERKPFRAPMS